MKTACSVAGFLAVSFLLSILYLQPAYPGNTKHTRRTPATQRPYVINSRTYYPIPSANGYEETGTASWYGSDFHGRSTSNGEKYNMHDMTAAHKVLPMNTMLLVTNLRNKKQVVVRVNDRGPFVKGRIIDLSFSAAKKIDMQHTGTAKVRVLALGEVRKINGKRQFIKRFDFDKGSYYVQIGAFIRKDNSLRLQQKFLEKGHRTVIRKTRVHDKLFYRVQVYVGSSLRNAKKAEAALLEKGYTGAFIIAI